MSKLFFAGFAVVLCLSQTLKAQQVAKLVIPIGHTAAINAIDVSPDGRFYLTGSLDNTAKIWDDAGFELRTLAGHSKNVRAVAFSPITSEDPKGGKHILTGSNDYTAILWDQLGNQLGKFTEPAEKNGEITSVAFSPNGKELLAGTQSGNAWLLNDTCKAILKFTHSEELNSVAFSPNGDFILTTCSNKTAVLWKRSSPNAPFKIFQHNAAVTSAVFSPSGDTILTGCADGTAVLWKSKGEKIRSFQHAAVVTCVGISADGSLVATGSSNGTIKVWNLSDAEANPIQIFDRGLNGLKFTPDGQKIICASDKKNLAKVCDLKGLVLAKLDGHTSAITSLAISKDGTSLLVGHADSTAKMWDLFSQKVRNFPYNARVESVTFLPQKGGGLLPEGKVMLTGCDDRVCRMQDQNGKLLEQPFTQANKAVFSEDGTLVLTGNTDGTLKIWDLTTKQSIPILHSERSVTALAFSPLAGSKAFAIGSSDGGVVYWDSMGAQAVSFKLSMPMPILALAFASDGKSIVLGEQGGLTEVWDLSGKRIKEYPNRKRGAQNVKAVAFTPPTATDKKGGKYVLRATGNYVERWDIKEAKVDTFSGHTAEVIGLAITPDGSSCFTASKDGTVKFWNIASCKLITTLVSIDSTDWAVTSPSGLYDASPGAAKLMHYTSGMDMISFRQIKERYYEAFLLSKLTGFSSDSISNVSRIDSLSMFPEVLMNIVGNKLEVSLKVRNGGIGKLSLFVNKKRMIENINPDKLKTIPPVDLDQFSNFYRSDVENTIGLISYNGNNVLRSQPYERIYKPFGSRGDNDDSALAQTAARNNCATADPHIYLIVVGTSKYRDSTVNLAYPDLDAQAMAKALSDVGLAMRPGRVHLKQLSSSPGPGVELATKENIHAAFKAFAAESSPCDVFVAYFSGHGKTWGPEGKKANFYYLTSGISSGKIRDDGLRNAHAISDMELEEWLRNIPAQKQVLILDACHSGAAAENLKGIGQRELSSNQMIALSLLNDRTGTWILSGSMADMKSYEASRFGQGLLTYSLLSGMNGGGLDRKEVDVDKLFQYARKEVPKLAESIGQTQTPVILGEGESFPIGLNDGSIRINLPQPKDVFIPSKFQSKQVILDNLQLGDALNDFFYSQRLKGAQAKYVYYETSTVLNTGYRVEGSYDENGDMVLIHANLFKGNNPIGEPFELKGTKDTKALVDLIVKEIKPRMDKKN